MSEEPTTNAGDEHEPATEEEEDDDPPWKAALGGLAIWGITGFFFVRVQALEAGESGTVRVWWPFALLYNTVGKWPAVALGAVLGGLVIAMAVHQWRGRKAS